MSGNWGSGKTLRMRTEQPNPREIRDMRVKDIVGKAMVGEITWLEAERILGYSARHVRRLRARCVSEGAENLRDRRTGRAMPRKVCDDQVREILHLRESRYFDFNVRHFHERLQERHGIHLSYTYVKNLLQSTGLATRAKARGKHRRRRERRPMRGMMLQMDGSPHAWLGLEHGARTLLSVLDDADGRVLFGQFVLAESTHTCLWALQYILENYGLFSEVYIDRASQFGFTRKAGEPVEPGHTQFERVLGRFRIRPIYAGSPQAKGRIERSYRTQQGRIPQELREAGIAGWEAANRYLHEVFWPDFNRKFTVEPQSPASAFIPTVGIDLRRGCALEHPVTVAPDNCVRWRRRVWQIPENPSRYSFARCKAVLVEYLDGCVDIEYGQLTIARFDANAESGKLPQRRATTASTARCA
jgi:transposase